METNAMVTLQLVINGEPWRLAISPSATVRGVLRQALAERPSAQPNWREWEIRTAAGSPLDEDVRVADLPQERLYMNLRAGVGA